jgi:hypothetical protein
MTPGATTFHGPLQLIGARLAQGDWRVLGHGGAHSSRL